MLNYVTIKKFAELSGYTEKAVREKIRQGIWPEGTICHHAPDGRLLISLTEYEQWVEMGAALKRLRRMGLSCRNGLLES